MLKNPIVNAVLATGYITLVVSLLYYSPKFVDEANSVLAPIAMLSLLVLSVATMAYLFFYTPVMLYVENRKEESIRYFFKTLGAFAGITILLFVVLGLLS